MTTIGTVIRFTKSKKSYQQIERQILEHLSM